jgi:membrane-associated protease RseP (regulator of RpoE activity)
LVEALGKSSGFTVKKIAEGHGPSDQESFYLKNIPVVFAFTGNHRDYHRPSDDIERINFEGMSRIADFSELLLLDLARRPRRPDFVKVERRNGQGQSHAAGDPGRLSVSAYLGTIPSYDEDTKGVKLEGVREGSPAENGGIRGGDIIVGFGGKPVATIYDYTESLGRYKPGDTVEVVVKRDSKDVTLKVTLGLKPSE